MDTWLQLDDALLIDPETVRFGPSPDETPTPRAAQALGDAVDVWSIDLAPDDATVARCRARLSVDEIAKVDRFHFDRDRRRATVARGALRVLLGGYLDRAPEALRFVYGPQGKPFLAGAGGQADPDAPSFNVSHSEDRALIAVTRAVSARLDAIGVGVDVERVRAMPDGLDIAEHFFAAGERATLRQVLTAAPSAQQAVVGSATFFRCWTRKEAYLKATGKGLSLPLDRFEVSLVPGTPARMRALDGDVEAARDWTLVHLALDREHLGALALPRAAIGAVRGWQLAPERLR
ncbi:MAG: 4'-phosphopantetheinyl transferase superfamily protein [Acidobacteriota bacterium]